MRLLVLVIALVAGFAPAAASAAPRAPTYAPPPDNPLKMRPDADRPTEVAIGLYLLNNTQMQISITSMLAAIAFNFAISSSLPTLAYLTWIDAFIFTCYSIIFLSIVEDMVVHVTWRSRRRDLAHRLDRGSRWAFPLAFLLVNFVLALRFLGSRLPPVAPS